MSKSCFEQAHMTCAEFGLWVQYRKLAYASGKLFCDGRTTAERFDGMSKSQIYRIRKSLVGKGWLVIVKNSDRTKGGRYSSTVFHVLDHEQWVKRHGRKHCKTELFEGLSPVPPVQTAKVLPVPSTGMTCPTGANGPVPSTGHSSKEKPVLNMNQLQVLGATSATPDKLVVVNAESSLAEPTKPPVPPVQMVDPVPGDFATLNWPHFDHYIWPHLNR